MKQMRAGISLRWLNTAGFEMILSDGSHLLVDPWLDEADVYPFKLDDVERADYILLTHTHYDHVQSIGRIHKKFPQAAIFIGDLSAEALCREYDLNVERIFRVRSGENYVFDNVEIEVIAGRHTESKTGNYWNRGYCIQADGTRNMPMWYGSLEMFNYRITSSNGTRVVIWGGMTTQEQIHRMEKYCINDIAIMHVSPKQDHNMFARLVNAIKPKVVIPHHYDMWDKLFEARPELKKEMGLPADRLNADKVLGIIADNLERECKNVDFYIPKHHKWYWFGIGVEEC